MPESTIELPGPAATVEEFLALRDRLATTPQGGAAMFVLALEAYARDEALGLACLTTLIEHKQLGDGPGGFRGKAPSRAAQQALRDRIGAKPWLARSYLQGTSPATGYAAPPSPWRVAVREQPGDVAADRAKVFVHCTGADSPRPLHLVKNEQGIWKANNWSSLEVGCRPPVAKSDEI